MTTFALIIGSVVIVGAIILQIYLAKKKSKWAGLIIPLIFFSISIQSVLITLFFSVDVVISSTIYDFLVNNIPTVILMIIYIVCRGKRNEQRALEIEKKQDSKKILLFGIIAFMPIFMLSVVGLVLYLRQPLHGWSLHSLGGLIRFVVIMLSLPIVPLTIILSVLGIKSRAKRLKSEQTTHDKIGFILAIASCLIVVCHLIVIVLLPVIN